MIVPAESLQLQVDETLDQGGVLKKLNLSRCNFNEFQFKSLLKAMDAATKNVVQGNNDIQITELDLSHNQVIEMNLRAIIDSSSLKINIDYYIVSDNIA